MTNTKQEIVKNNYVVNAAGRIAGVPCDKDQVVQLTAAQAKYENVTLSSIEDVEVEEIIGENTDANTSSKSTGDKAKRGKPSK